MATTRIASSQGLNATSAASRDHVQSLTQECDASRGLAPRALELVVEVRVLELLQVQGRRVAHDAHTECVGEEVADEGFVVARRAGEPVGEQRHRQLEQDEPGQVAPVRRGRADVGDHAVDNELADPEQDHRRERIHEPEREDGEPVERARRPHHAQEGREVTERTEARRDGRERLPLPVARLVEDGGHGLPGLLR
jgi:hypothetical protein